MAWYKCKGVKKAQMVDSFSVATWSTNTACGYWDAPSSGKFEGVRIVYSTVSAPSSPDDGVLFYEGTGSDLQLTAITEVHGANASGFTTGVTYYFSCFSYIGNPHKYNKGKYKTAQWTATNCAGSWTPDTGTWTVPTGVRNLDIFVVGGGGGGGGGWSNNYSPWAFQCGGGGGGGYTSYTTSIAVLPEMEIDIALGGGGYGGGYQYGGGSGGTTTVSGTDANGTEFTVTASGGGGGGIPTGGSGGSGGGGGGGSSLGVAGNGGTNGGNGEGTKGTGQGTTTKPFGEADGIPYAGGGAGSLMGRSASQQRLGGYYGGGNGGVLVSGTIYAWQSSGIAKTGGGGGGAGWYANTNTGYGGTGGSGLALLRSA